MFAYVCVWVFSTFKNNNKKHFSAFVGGNQNDDAFAMSAEYERVVNTTHMFTPSSSIKAFIGAIICPIVYN